VPRGQGNLAGGDLVQHIKVAVVDRLLNQTADKELVLVSGHRMPRFRRGEGQCACRRAHLNLGRRRAVPGH
jgi:hypothetical protein